VCKTKRKQRFRELIKPGELMKPLRFEEV
jgi:hypothetical protein